MRFLLLGVLCVGAFGMCFEPMEPSCIGSSYTYQNEYSFNSCKNDLQYYLNELNSYVRCVANEASEKADEAISEFNSRASRGY